MRAIPIALLAIAIMASSLSAAALSGVMSTTDRPGML
mgnify:CR=1 FL=1